MPDENTLTAYKKLCTSYRAIDDFRAKLLGFLPLATGGVFLLIDKPEDFEKIKPLLFFEENARCLRFFLAANPPLI